MDYFPLIIFLILIIILLIAFYINIFLKKNYLEEKFSGSLDSLPLSGATAYLRNYDIPISQSNTQLNPLDNNYLYPSSCKLNDQCKAMGLIGSSNPSICIQNGKINIGLFHGPINGLKTDLGYSFGEESFDSSKFNGLEITLCGDIHKRQIIYTESIIEIDEELLDVYVKKGWEKA
jgi:hypothetical protein